MSDASGGLNLLSPSYTARTRASTGAGSGPVTYTGAVPPLVDRVHAMGFALADRLAQVRTLVEGDERAGWVLVWGSHPRTRRWQTR